ncbi:hypothetical protein UFOVP232_6 [uncultured Caudovirales phage]|uniref:Uncharacterized protein n=1 Tax=uncultured Caudovirales phage TaxID=2100421 RepID=A0A6J7WT05_9CAUD|nr:hypothetical protein UFOVP232_6 [uncultured Caudovirales phage]
MAANKKPRKQYKPKRNLVNPVGFVLEGLVRVKEHNSILLNLKIRNHASMSQLTKGLATHKDIDELISMTNITEALYRLGFGTEYKDVVKGGLESLRAVGRRGAESGRFVLKAAEMHALNEVMDLHDAQMDVITVNDMEKAIALVNKEFKDGKMTPITEAAHA